MRAWEAYPWIIIGCIDVQAFNAQVAQIRAILTTIQNRTGAPPAISDSVPIDSPLRRNETAFWDPYYSNVPPPIAFQAERFHSLVMKALITLDARRVGGTWTFRLTGGPFDSIAREVSFQTTDAIQFLINYLARVRERNPTPEGVLLVGTNPYECPAIRYLAYREDLAVDFLEAAESYTALYRKESGEWQRLNPADFQRMTFTRSPGIP